MTRSVCVSADSADGTPGDAPLTKLSPDLKRSSETVSVFAFSPRWLMSSPFCAVKGEVVDFNGVVVGHITIHGRDLGRCKGSLWQCRELTSGDS